MCSDAWLQRYILAIPDWARSSIGRPPRRDREEKIVVVERGGACGHVSDKISSNSRTSKDREEMTVVHSPKRVEIVTHKMG
ncbi:hypothetical protein DPMN_094038 [Dreissena polymorpha]|uniref:Uncharacterized protein n=1 Tax=Dreissena polymorpha TaxID=45954 RepID=A0A9D4L4Q3_DREPO|nr:hypothetical protein DPMN_094038 [Dreissena polymorpha]